MKHQTIFALLALLAFTACKASNSSSNHQAESNPATNGHYMITPKVMKGECDQPDPLVFVIWKGEVHNDGIHGDLDITGSVYGIDVTGIATDADDNDNQFVFDARFYMEGNVVVTNELYGEWYSSNGECEGTLKGERI